MEGLVDCVCFRITSCISSTAMQKQTWTNTVLLAETVKDEETEH